METKYFLVVFVVIFILGLVSAQECDPGVVEAERYCDSYGYWQDFSEGGETCLNDYECLTQSCVDGICQSSLPSFSERTNFLEEVWSFFSGEMCDPEYDTDYYCEGDVAYLCGENHVWEEKGVIPGVCGVPEENNTEPEDPSNPDNGGPSGGGSDDIDVVIVSPRNITYSTTSVLLEVYDTENEARYWRYTLNNEDYVEFDGKENIVANVGRNVLEVSASKYGTFSNDELEEVVFNVVPSSGDSYCGNDVCDANEDCGSCFEDCGRCSPIGSYCGDGVCDIDESSAICPADCDAEPRDDRMWMFYVLIILFSLGIIFVAYVLLARFKGWSYFWKKWFDDKPGNLGPPKTGSSTGASSKIYPNKGRAKMGAPKTGKGQPKKSPRRRYRYP